EFLPGANPLLLLFGIFREPLPGVVLLVPIPAPIAAAPGIAPPHFALVVIVRLPLGMLTPPVRSLLFVVSSATKVEMGPLIRELCPFLFAHFIVLLALTFVPVLSTGLPRALGF